MAFPFLIVILIIIFLIYLYNYSKDRPENFPPGPPRLPFWGSYWFLLKENYQLLHLSLEKLSKKYQTDVMGLYLGNAPTVVTFTNELTRELLTREEFIGRPDNIVIRTRSLNDLKGLFFVDGPLWKNQRRFTLRHLRDFGFGRRFTEMENFVTGEVKYLIDLFNGEIKEDVSDICKEDKYWLFPDVLYGPLQNSFLLAMASTRYDNRKLREVARAGLRFQRSEDGTGSAINMTPWLRFIAPDYFGFTPSINDIGYILDFLREVVAEHSNTFDDNDHRDFVDTFLSEMQKPENSFEFTEKQLLILLLDILFPSAIALGHTLNFFFALIINNPDVQIKIQEEIEKVVGNSRLPTLDDRKNMPYTEASIREATRIVPLNPLGITRRCIQDTTLGGYFIPKDTIMIPCVWSAHHDPKVWDEPKKFMPERFLDDKGNLSKKDLTMGFGAGKRLCIGETFSRQNMFLIISGLLQHFTFTSYNDKPVDVVNLIPGVNLSTKDNWVKAIPK